MIYIYLIASMNIELNYSLWVYYLIQEYQHPRYYLRIKFIFLEGLMGKIGKMMFLLIILVIIFFVFFSNFIDDNIWEYISPAHDPPRPRCRHTSVIYKSNMYVFGGNDNEKSFNDMYVLSMGSFFFIKKIKINFY